MADKKIIKELKNLLEVKHIMGITFKMAKKERISFAEIKKNLEELY
ncbi:MAG: hypothetical protein ABDH37_07435 [Candidatus Hydrothermales bacterium]